MFKKKCDVCSSKITLKEYYKLTWWNHKNFKCPHCNNVYKVTEKSMLIYSVIIVIPIIYTWTSFKLGTIFGLGFTFLWIIVCTLIVQPVLLVYEKDK